MAKEQLWRSEAPLSATWWLPAAAYDESSSTGVKVKAGARFRVSVSWRRESAMCVCARRAHPKEATSSVRGHPADASVKLIRWKTVRGRPGHRRLKVKG